VSDPIAEITDHVAEAQARVVGALKEKNRYVSLLASVVTQVQDLETVFFELLKERSLTKTFNDGTGIIAINSNPTNGGSGYVVGDVLIVTEGNDGEVVVDEVAAGVITKISIVVSGSGYTIGVGKATTGGTGTGATIEITDIGSLALGVQLDNLGKIMGLARYSGQSDVEYRLDLISWVRFLFSQGEGDTLLFVLKALTNSTTVSISETFPGSVILYFDGVIYNEENLSSLMDRCAAAGIGVDLVPVSDTTFRYDTPGVGYDEGLYTIALRTE